MTTKIELQEIEMIDNHCHPLLDGYLERNLTGFRAAFSESNEQAIFLKSVPNTLSYNHMLSVLKTFIPFEDEQDYIDLRKSRDDLVTFLFDKVNLGTMLVDDGFNQSDMLTVGDYAALCKRPVYRILRLETELEELIANHDTVSDIVSELERLLQDRENIKGIKTIAAYRGGLDIKSVTEVKAQESLNYTKWMHSERGGSLRLKGEEHHHYFLEQAFRLASELNLAVQIHCGFGDGDLELHKSNPALLTNCFKNEEYRNANFVLLHCYPYVTEAGYLASLFSNVYFDLSLVPLIVSQKMKELYVEAIASSPSNKILAGTDGHSVPETHFYGAYMTRVGLSSALQSLTEDGFMDETRSLQIANQILSDNAKSIYKLHQ